MQAASMRPSDSQLAAPAARSAAVDSAKNTWSLGNYGMHGSFNHSVAGPVIDMLRPRRGERVLDLGCGDGVVTQQLVAAGCSVVGVDASPELLESAAGLGLDARLMDGHELTFDGEFDAVFSHAALHWMKKDPSAVLRGVKRALRPGGRFVADFGGQGNALSVRVALTAVLAQEGIDANVGNPWYFPSDTAYRELLIAEGFDVESCTLVYRPTVLPTNVSGWLETFCTSFLDLVPEQRRQQVLEAVAAAVVPNLTDAEGKHVMDYVRCRVVAHVPAANGA